MATDLNRLWDDLALLRELTATMQKMKKERKVPFDEYLKVKAQVSNTVQKMNKTIYPLVGYKIKMQSLWLR